MILSSSKGNSDQAMQKFSLLTFGHEQTEEPFDFQSLDVLKTGETDILQIWHRNSNPALILFALFSMTRELIFELCLLYVKNIPGNVFHLFSRRLLGTWSFRYVKRVSELLQEYEVEVKLSEKVSANIYLV